MDKCVIYYKFNNIFITTSNFMVPRYPLIDKLVLNRPVWCKYLGVDLCSPKLLLPWPLQS